MATIEVFPNKSGGWHWRRDNHKSKSFETRREAIETARDEKEPGDNVVLLRLDGSLYGELFHAEGGGAAQHVDITPAGETGEVV